MAMGDVIARLSVSLNLETAAFEKGATIAEKRMAQSAKSFEKMGKKLGDVGRNMSLAVTVPLIALAKKSVDGFIEQEKAMADVNAALKSMGKASGKTSKELLKTADAMEMKSLYDADVILKQVTANLLTFGNVAGKQFDRAQQAAVDMATRLGTAPQSAAIMLGKALNDPIKGITALTRVGVQFTDQQREQIAAMQKAGDTAGAQGVILAEVEKQFKGAGAAAADASPWRQAQVAIGQAMDVIGEAILPVIRPIAETIADLARKFASLPEPMQKMAVAGLAIAAALGPILMLVGPLITLFAPLLGTIRAIAAAQGIMVATSAGIAGLASTLAPIAGLVLAGYVVWKNWDDIAPRLQPLIDQLRAIGEGLGLIAPKSETAAAAMVANVQEMAEAGGLAATSTAALEAALTKMGEGAVIDEAALSSYDDLVTKLQSAGTISADEAAKYRQAMNDIRTATVETQKTNSTGWKAFGEDLREASDQLQKWADDFDAMNARNRVNAGKFWRGLDQGWDNLVVSAHEMAANVKKSISDMVTGIGNAITGRLSAILDGAKEKIDNVTGWFRDMYVAVVGNSYVPDMVDGIRDEFARLDKVMVDPAARAAETVTERMRRMAAEMRELMGRLFPEIEQAMRYDADLARLGGGGPRGYAIGEKERRLRNEKYNGNPLGRTGNREGIIEPIPSSEWKINGEAATKVLKDIADKAKVHTVRIAKSFKDMAEGTLGALRNMTEAIKGGGFLDILEGIIGLGLQLGSIGAFGKKIQANINNVPGNANGTRNWGGGLSWVGERGPELVNMPRGSQVFTNRESMAMGGGKLQVEVVANNNGFGAMVRNEAGQVVAAASPSLMQGGAQIASSRLSRRQSRSI